MKLIIRIIEIMLLVIIIDVLVHSCFNKNYNQSNEEKNKEEILNELNEENKISEEELGEEIIMLQTKDDVKHVNKKAKEDAEYFFDTYLKQNGIEAYKNLSIEQIGTKIKNDIIDKKYADKYDKVHEEELTSIYFDIITRWTLNPYLSFEENRELHIYKLMDDLSNFYNEHK